jgi:hypothetical protein
LLLVEVVAIEVLFGSGFPGRVAIPRGGMLAFFVIPLPRISEISMTPSPHVMTAEAAE